jgi:hypothetical protein
LHKKFGDKKSKEREGVEWAGRKDDQTWNSVTFEQLVSTKQDKTSGQDKQYVLERHCQRTNKV